MQREEKKLSEMVEKIGISRVTDDKKWMGLGTLANNWLWIGIYPLGLLQGFLYAPLGLEGQILANVLIFASWFLVAGGMIEAGRRTGLTELIMGRIGLGWYGNIFFALLLVFTNLGWFGLQTQYAAVTFNTVFPFLHEIGWLLLIAVIMIGILAFGIKGLTWLNYVSTALFLVMIGYIVYIFFTKYPIPWSTIPLWANPRTVDIGALYTSMAGFVYVGWAYKFPSMSRWCKPYDKTKSQFRGKNLLYFSLPLTMLLIANIPLEIMGTLSYYATPTHNWNALAIGLGLLPVAIAIPAVIALAGAMINTNVLNLYPGIMQVLATEQSLGLKGKITNQLLWTIILSLLGTFLAIIGLITFATTFTAIVAAATGPFAVILVTDLYLVRKFNINFDSIFHRPPFNTKAAVDVGGILIMAVGAIIAYYFDSYSFYPFTVIPGYLVGAIVTFVLYYTYRKRTGPNGYLM